MSAEWQLAIEFDLAAFLIHAVVSGMVRPEAVPALAGQVVEAARSRQCPFVILDYTRARVRGTLIDLYSGNSRLERLGLKPTDVVAVVHSAETNRQGRNELAETVAWNRGWRNVRYFTDLATARAWIYERQQTASPGAAG